MAEQTAQTETAQAPAPDQGKPQTAPAPGGKPPADGAGAPPPEYGFLTDGQKQKYLKDGKLDVETLAKAHASAESLIGKRTEDMRKEIEEQWKTERTKGLPPDPSKYVANVPEGVSLPPGVEWKWIENDPLMAEWRKIAHELGVPQEGFQRAVNAFVQREMNLFGDRQKEIEKLGPQAQERIGRVQTWLERELAEVPGAYKALHEQVVTAEGVKALEALMSRMNPQLAMGADGGSVSGAPGTQVTSELIDQMMEDPRYRGHNKDTAYIERVRELMAQGIKAGTIKRRRG